MRSHINIIKTLFESVQDQTADDLEHFGHEDRFNIKNHDDGPALFPSGGQWFICTDWSEYVRRELGDRAKLYGFEIDQKNVEQEGDYSLLSNFDGHDFAVVDDRYIVDGWLKNVDGLHDKAVIDMKDPANTALVRSLYGDPKHWVHNTDLEKYVDHENAKDRAKAFDGVTRYSPTSSV